MKELIADADAAGKRLDQWLAIQLAPDLSRSRIQSLIAEGQVTVDGRPVHEPKHKLREGALILLQMPEPEPAEPEGENIPLDILHEDNDVIVINKPAGLVVHPGNGNWTGTLVNALIHHCGDTLSGIGGVRRPGIVHRLDKETSGVMVVAKNDRAHRQLSAQFADHGRTGDLERAYMALVWGTTDRATGTVDAPLGRSHRDRTRQAVVNENREDARHAVTHYSVVEKFGQREDATALASLIECRLETGRTHQIRVHMAHIGHPLIGDMEYGSAFKTKANKLAEPLKQVVTAFPRQALHARLLSFAHPANDVVMRFEAPLPEDMAQLLAAFRVYGQ
ncbi:RluA family pseudouridine synthase [Mesorhizobium sp. RMAD-H1]|uniref:RluA family pseudouridine synthase n=1 Tax=Mesorhizobium sp. RMAD-H1 TaxID=2587065 RepID=UPI001621A9BE|nr:RluA family pseudouridine synthase [Mesorhizobium sp. RMAD-H1]MBB2973549.1 23S rRNA pseudouridine1911/1915/1917 synthase [Mesorhizobium sp. RMAD-H1]